MQDCHFNILINFLKKNHAIICKIIITRGGNEEVAAYGTAPLFIPSTFSPSSPSLSFFHSLQLLSSHLFSHF